MEFHGFSFVACLLLLFFSSSDSGAIPSTFFAITSSEGVGNFPTVPFGTEGHPAQFAWVWIERSRGNYTWFFDPMVNAAPIDSNNVAQIVLTLGTTPGWALADQSTCVNKYGILQCTAPPDNITDWTNFITALVGHYNGITAPHIKYYELWNEFTANNFWSGNVTQMIALGHAAYPIIRTDPYSSMLGPSTTGPSYNVTDTSPAAFSSYISGGGPLDGGSFHGYVAPFSPSPPLAIYPFPEDDTVPGCGTCMGSIITKANTYRQVLNQNNLSSLPLFNTEGSFGQNTITDIDLQSAWLARWYILQAGLASSLNLIHVSWYDWELLQNGTQTTNAATAYATVYYWLVNSTISPCTSSGTVWTCSLIQQNGQQALLVWDTNQTCSNGNCTTSSFASGSYSSFTNLLGNIQTITGGQVNIGAKPILLTGSTQITGSSNTTSSMTTGGSSMTGSSPSSDASKLTCYQLLIPILAFCILLILIQI